MRRHDQDTHLIPERDGKEKVLKTEEEREEEKDNRPKVIFYKVSVLSYLHYLSLTVLNRTILISPYY